MEKIQRTRPRYELPYFYPPSISLVFKIYFLVWVGHCSGKEIISTFCFCWLICRNTETHILLNNTNNLHLKFICLVPWRPTEQNVCNKYSCAGDTIALEKTKTWSLVQEAYSPKEVREKFWETWLPVWVCFFPNVPCPFLMVWLCSCWFFFFLKAGMPVLFTSHQKPTQALRFQCRLVCKAFLSPTVGCLSSSPLCSCSFLFTLDYTTKIHLEWCLWFKVQDPALFIKLSL